MKPYERLIIDGYNLLHADPELSKMVKNRLAEARQRLIRMVEEAAFEMASYTTVVFDGRQGGNEEALESTSLEVYFSPSHLTADSIIERLVCALSNPERCLVITSDRAEQHTVSSAGAHTLSSEEFSDYCRRRKKQRHERPPGPSGSPLGDFFPDDL